MLVLVLGVFTVTGDTWTWTQRYNGPKRLNDVAAGGVMFVAVGTAGTILSSPDGIEWTERISKTYHGLHSVIWGDEMFVAGGDSGVIVTSGDGVEWTVRRTGGDKSIYSMVWGGGMYVAGSHRNGRIAHIISSDGVEWVERDKNNDYYMSKVNFTYGDGIFMEGENSNFMHISTDGITWEMVQGPCFDDFTCSNCRSYPTHIPGDLCMPSTGGPVHSIAYGNGTFLWLGETGGLARYYKGKEWEIIDYDCDWNGKRKDVNIGHIIIYDGTRFVMAGNGVYFTENGDEFERVSTALFGINASIAYNGNVYVTVDGVEIGTLSEGYSSMISSKQTSKPITGFTVRQSGKVLKITTPNQNAHLQIAIYNLAGKRQKINPNFHTDGTVSVPLAGFAAGSYIVGVNDESNRWAQRILVRGR